MLIKSKNMPNSCVWVGNSIQLANVHRKESSIPNRLGMSCLSYIDLATTVQNSNSKVLPFFYHLLPSKEFTPKRGKRQNWRNFLLFVRRENFDEKKSRRMNFKYLLFQPPPIIVDHRDKGKDGRCWSGELHLHIYPHKIQSQKLDFFFGLDMRKDTIKLRIDNFSASYLVQKLYEYDHI